MDCADVITGQRTFFQTGQTRPLTFRHRQLAALAEALERHERDLLAALQADLGKSAGQSLTTELGPVRAELVCAVRNLARWTRPRPTRIPWLASPGKAWIQPEPRGVCLILGPWNYPLQLLLTPLVSAIAAGNCAVLKPSELATATATAVQTLIAEIFPPEYVAFVSGGPETAEALLAERFDHIFFTGSTTIGRRVMAAAARHLTPVTLELGGKCPAIVMGDADLATTARRLAWGKFLNAGQTCVAPDFVLVEQAVYEPLLAELKIQLANFYGPDPARSPDYGRIINARHHQRLVSLLPGGNIYHGGGHDSATRYFAPTILTGVAADSPLLTDEIFGPLLPVLPFASLAESLARLQQLPAPLALYLFTRNRRVEQQVLQNTRSGGVCINDVVMHMIGTGLPFGGVGDSGMGAYHGRAGFETFSQERSVLRRTHWPDLPFRYPPERLSPARLKRWLPFLLRS